ncbi:hypothetical protein [Massilia sp. S19_KUP03_FR1]|uniref:hypothetical protein n=1 Tax=Massilia sp. S19_KUP03_FR1 TaxID=3025503 RepID=UPI002FCDC19F
MRSRLQWYARSTARLLLRRWQALLLACGVLAAANSSILGNARALGYPLLVMFEPGHGALWRGAYLLLLLAVAAAWVLMQRDQIEGGGFMQFARTLPFSRRHLRRVDIVVLVLADTPLLLVVCCAGVASLQRGSTGAELVLLIDVALLGLLTQLCALERRLDAALAPALAGLALGAASTSSLALPAGLLAGALASLLLGAAIPRARMRWQRAGILTPLARAGASLAQRLPPAGMLSVRILCRALRAEAAGKAIAAASIAAAALGLMRIFDYDARAFPLALLAQGVVALCVSGLYRGMHIVHTSSAAYCAALPLKKQWWRWYDIATLLGFALPFLALLGGAPVLHGAVAPAHAAAGVASFALLLVMLRTVQLASERQAVVLVAIVTGCWIAATIACLT